MYGVREDLNCAGGVLLFDGLLCDVTVRGIERWIAEIGEPRAGLEVSLCWIALCQSLSHSPNKPAERIADPMFVSALLSLVLSMRNKLSALGYSNVSAHLTSSHIVRDTLPLGHSQGSIPASSRIRTSAFIICLGNKWVYHSKSLSCYPTLHSTIHSWSSSSNLTTFGHGHYASIYRGRFPQPRQLYHVPSI